MTISRHPEAAWLIDYACGNLSRGFELLVSAHVSVCETCAGEVMSAERLGAELMLNSPPAPVGLTAGELLEAGATRSAWSGGRSMRRPGTEAADLEAFVAHYLDCGLSALPWRKAGRGLQIANLRAESTDRLWLLRAAANTVLPRHRHGGSELTLVLKGAYFNGHAIYAAGDLEDADETTEHQPIVTREGECLCLAATEGPLRFASWLPRLAQRYLGI